jgi:hypothetical protein
MVIAKCFVALVVGLFAVVVLNLGVDVIVHAFAPTWDDLVENDRGSLFARSNAIWFGSLFGLSVASVFGAIVGSWLAARLGLRSHIAHGIVVGSILLVVVIQAILIAGHPFLVLAGALAVLPLCTYAGRRLAARGRNGRIPNA